MKSKISIFIIILCIILSAPATVSAKDNTDPYYLSATKLKLVVGNSYQLYLLNLNDDSDFWFGFYYYPCTWSTSNSKVASIDENGYITANKKGKATITAKFNGKSYKCKVTVGANKYKLNISELSMKTFDKTELKMTHNSKIEYYGSEVHSVDKDGSEKEVSDAFYINIDNSTGNISLEALLPGTYRISFYAYAPQNDGFNTLSYKADCIVDVSLYGLIDSDVSCALGTAKQLTFGGLTGISFIVSDPGIASVNSEGIITPYAVGNTSVTMTGIAPDGSMPAYECNIWITDPQVTLEKTFSRVDESIDLEFDNTSWYSDISYSSSDPDIISIQWGTPYASKEGKADLTVDVDGRRFTFTIEIVDPRLEDEVFLLSPSSTKEISILGLNAALKKEPVKYEVENKKIASVSTDGIITAKKSGCTMLTVAIGDFVMQSGISVGKEKAVQAVKNALSVLGAKYSQEKRMQEGFYDCSSLAWRSYAPCGVTFGSDSYAPTAANTAKYMAEHNKVIAGSLSENPNLQPGDLIFYSGGSNERYLNIYHVAVFVGLVPGYSYNYYDDSYNSYSRMIVHASGGCVSLSTSPESYGEVVMIARPCKK